MIIVVLRIVSMQIGLLMLEVGTIRASNSRSVIYKNIIVNLASALMFYTVGYGLSYGSEGGLIGVGGLFDHEFGDLDYRKWIISYCFCSTTCSIATSALAERTF